jgi:hypothetical protein
MGGQLGMIGAIYGVPTANGKPEDLVDGIEIGRGHILAHEWAHMDAQRSETIVDEIRDVEALGDRAHRVQEYLELFGDSAYTMTHLHAVQAVTKARMLGAVDHFLDLDRAALIIVTPDPAAPRSGKVVEEVKR